MDFLCSHVVVGVDPQQGCSNPRSTVIIDESLDMARLVLFVKHCIVCKEVTSDIFIDYVCIYIYIYIDMCIYICIYAYVIKYTVYSIHSILVGFCLEQVHQVNPLAYKI